jgi:hypothetical protein
VSGRCRSRLPQRPYSRSNGRRASSQWRSRLMHIGSSLLESGGVSLSGTSQLASNSEILLATAVSRGASSSRRMAPACSASLKTRRSSIGTCQRSQIMTNRAWSITSCLQTRMKSAPWPSLLMVFGSCRARRMGEYAFGRSQAPSLNSSSTVTSLRVVCSVSYIQHVQCQLIRRTVNCISLPISNVTSHDDRHLFASSGDDGTIKVWSYRAQ